jgi:hypothetical protein
VEERNKKKKKKKKGRWIEKESDSWYRTPKVGQ